MSELAGTRRGGPPSVKICGLTRPEDARLAEESGASHVGAVLVPGSPREITASRASELARTVSVPLVIVTADLGSEDAAVAAERAGAGAIQLHGDEPPDQLRELRRKGPWELWKAVRVRSRDDILRAMEEYGSLVDVLLLDGWKKGELGGTGTVFPWTAMDSVREAAPLSLRIGVAGGLSPANVSEAVRRLDPDLVDVSSGVEVGPGIKDPEKVREFVRRARVTGQAAGQG